MGDAVFLVIMGVFGLASGLASYVAGSGSFEGIFMNDPRVIGVVEAHGLAVPTGAAGFAHASSNRKGYWHLHFAATHLLVHLVLLPLRSPTVMSRPCDQLRRA